MATIRVPGPPPEAFQKNRPISDLIKSQIKHFQHLEHKLQITLPTKFSPHDLTTEAAASRYIAEMTAALCNQPVAAAGTIAPVGVTPPKRPDSTTTLKVIRKPSRQTEPVDIAASASARKPPVKKHTAAKTTRKKKS